VVEHLPRKSKALSSTTSTGEGRRERGRKGRVEGGRILERKEMGNNYEAAKHCMIHVFLFLFFSKKPMSWVLLSTFY
jgi:hypothetical protein